MKAVSKLIAMGFVTLVVLSLFLSSAAFANDVYIAQSAAGSANGSSCANAYVYTYFNASGNWTSGTPSGTKIGPGTTVHLCGTVAVPAGTEALVFQGSGTSGNPVTLYFESGAKLQSPQWPADGSGGAIDIGSNSYLVINGNGGSGGATRGIIEATLNGDSGAKCPAGTCTSHGDSNGIEAASGSSNVTIEGLAIQNMYVTTGNPSPGGGSCTYIHGKATNWTIANNLMHDMSWCVNFQYDSGASSNVTISGNEIYNIDHGIVFGGPASGNTLQSVNIFGNYVHDYSIWDTPNDTWHHDGIHIWGYSNNGSDKISGVNIYNNRFGGCIGQNVTAHIFIEANSGSTSGVKIFNNSLVDTCSGNDTNGLLTTGIDSGYEVYNNTFIGSSGDVCVGMSSSPNNIFVNNVVSGCGELQYIASGGGFASGGLHNNIYANCSGGNCFVYHSTYTSSFPTWQSSTGQDASPSSYVSSAGVNASGVPQTGSAVIGVGANLHSLCSGQANPGVGALCYDIAGNARPATGNWDAGAYASGASSSSTAPPAPVVSVTSVQ